MTEPRTRHVWVRPPDIPVEHQGLLLEWRQYDSGDWWGRVLYVDREGREIMEWIPRDRIRPVRSEPNTGSAYG